MNQGCLFTDLWLKQTLFHLITLNIVINCHCQTGPMDRSLKWSSMPICDRVLPSLIIANQCSVHLWELWMELGSWSPGVLWKGKWKLEWSLEPVAWTLELWARKNKIKWNGQVTDWKFRLLANYNANLMLHSSFTGCSSLVLTWNGGFCIVGWFNFFCMAT